MRRRRMVLVYGTALGVLVADQITKWLVVTNLRGQPPVDVVGTFVQLRYTTNTGGAFSLLTGFPLFFGIMAIVIMALILLYAHRVKTRPTLMVLGLLLGGALGNFTDRLLRGDTLLRGEVVDFVDVGAWPVFNVADSCITVGAVLLAILMTREDFAARRAETAAETPTETSAQATGGETTTPATTQATTQAAQEPPRPSSLPETDPERPR